MRELKKKYIYVNQNKEIFGNIKVILTFLLILEAAVQRFSVKKVFSDISQNSQENTCARVPFLIQFQALGLQLY